MSYEEHDKERQLLEAQWPGDGMYNVDFWGQAVSKPTTRSLEQL
jgi:hypothetical protein